MNWIRRIGLLSLLAALVVVSGAACALAATVSEVADDVSQTGFHLDAGVSVSESDATGIVTAARNNGSRFYLVVLDETPPGGNSVFAEAVLDELGVTSGTILVLSPEDVGWVSDNEGFTERDQELAFEYANDLGGSDADFAANYVIALFDIDATGNTSAPATTVPATTATATSASSGGGGSSGLIWFLVIIVGIGLLLFWLVRRGQKQSVNASAERLATARQAIQKQVDAIANDILDLEDEVRVANNDEADQFYNQASETYRNLGDRLQRADTPQELLDISNDLDLAIWQLDCAEAILDDKPAPPKPAPKKLEPVPTAGDRVTIPAPHPDYQRRPSRRSSYMGPGMMEILIGVAGQVLAGGSTGRRTGGGLGAMVGGVTRRRSSPRARSGGGVVPGPGSPVPRSTRRTTRRRGGGRTRGGGKRRRS